MDSQIAIEPNIEASNYGVEPNLAYGSDVAGYTTPIGPSIIDYKFENGRRYHAYKAGNYWYPNDEQEKTRLDTMHTLTELTLEGNLHLAPVSQQTRRILDIGTGTGVWAVEMGDRYPSAEILGNDLSPIQPRWVPQNVRFEVDDVEQDWTFNEPFDYIHCRFMGNAIHDLQRLTDQCFEHTKPGGYLEMIDLDLEWTSPDGSLKSDHASLKFNKEFIKASRSANMEPCPGPRLEAWMKKSGFTDIHTKKYVWPIGTWPADKHLKQIGALNFLQIMEGLEAFTYALFTRQLGYSKEEVDVICANIRREIKEPKLHTMFNLYAVYGQKP